MARVLAISSQVVYGPVGLNCIVPALQMQGHEVLPVPTILLSNHPGHGKPEGRATAPSEISAMIFALEKLGAFKDLDAVITGYFASAEQIEIVATLIGRLKCKIILVDPVLGDDGKLYVAQAVAEAIRDKLVPLATIVTPNAFELSWLTGHVVGNENEAVGAARSLNVNEVLATSIPHSANELSTLRITRASLQRKPKSPTARAIICRAFILPAYWVRHRNQLLQVLCTTCNYQLPEAKARAF